MLKFGLISLLLMLTCASGPQFRAMRYPQVDQIWKQAMSQGAGGIEYVEESYCVLGGQHIDLILQYVILEWDMDSNQIQRALRPHCFVWVDKDGTVYARQFDTDMDGKIDAFTGDLKRLNKALDKLNG